MVQRITSKALGVLLGCLSTIGSLVGQETPEAGPPPPPTFAFSEASGLIHKPVQVTITCSDAEAQIRYTIDGTVPTAEDSAVYTAPISVKSSTTIRVIAMKDDQILAHDSTGYLRAEDDLLAFHSNLPLVVIDSFGDDIDESDWGNSQSVKRPVYGVILDVDEETGRSRIDAAPQFVGRAGMRVRGQTSTQFPKKQYTFETWDALDEDKSVALLGFPKESDWILHAPYSDKTLMRNVLAYQLFREMGHYAVGTRYVELFYNADGDTVGMDDYRGVYVFMEKIKRDKQRLPIAKLDETMTAPEQISGGYIFKKDKGTRDDVHFNTDEFGHQFGFVEPDEPNEAQFNYLSDHLNAFERILDSDQLADPEHGYRKFIDVGSFIDVHIHVELCRNIDGFRLSTYYHKDRNGKIVMGPVWDYNLSLGNTTMRGGEYPDGWYHRTIRHREYTYFDRLFDDRAFLYAHWDRYFELRSTILRTDKLMDQIDAIARELEEAQARNFKRWRILGRKVWQNPQGFWNRDTHLKEVDWMKRWLRDRLRWMDEQFTPPPVAKPAGGLLSPGQPITLDGSDRIAYSLDGSDPEHCRHTVISRQKLPIPHTTTLLARCINADGSLGALGTFHYEIPGSDPSGKRNTAASRWWLWLLAIGLLIPLWRLLYKRQTAS